MMSLLAAAPGNIDAKAQRGLTPLMFAASEGHANATALLVWNGADVGVQDDEGLTAFEYAKEACPACLSLLVNYYKFLRTQEVQIWR